MRPLRRSLPFLVGLAVSLPTGAAAQNLLRNPGFSAAAGLGEWGIYGFPHWNALDRLSQADSGSARLQMTGKPGGAEWIAQTNPVTPGVAYQFGAWANVSVYGLPDACGFRARYGFTGTGGTVQGEIPATGEVQGSWKRYQITVAAPAGAETGRLYVEAYGVVPSFSPDCGVTAFVDDTFLASVTTHVWGGEAGSGWANPASWAVGGAPAGDPNADLHFGAGPANRVATDDIPGAEYVHSITFGRGGYTVDAAVGSSLNLAGGIGASEPYAGSNLVALPILLRGGGPHAMTGQLNLTGLLSGETAADGLAASGLVTLAANNGYAGTTSIAGAGTLTVDGSQPSSPVAVTDGTLRGRGTVGAIAVAAGGTVAPGTPSATGVLTSAGNVAFGPGSTFAVRLDGPVAGPGHDQLSVQGGVTLDTSGVLPKLVVSAGTAVPVGQTFTILQATGALTGTFEWPDGGTFAADCQNFQVHYTATSVVLTRVAGFGPPLTAVAVGVTGFTTVCTNGTGGTATAADTGGCGNAHQWGYRTATGGPVTPIAGQTGPSYAIRGADFPGEGSFLLVETTTAAGGTAITSNEIPVTCLLAPSAAASGAATVCPGGTAVLQGSGGTACSWSPATGLSNPYSCTPTARPPATTTYTLTVTGNSCTSSNAPTVTVTVDPSCVTRFHPLPPCRLLDTRAADGPLGGPALAPEESRAFPVAGTCGIPADAVSLSVNLTVTAPLTEGFLVVYAGDGATAPETSSLNFRPGQTRANNALVSLATDGSGRVRVKNRSTGTSHAILDVNGYFR